MIKTVATAPELFSWAKRAPRADWVCYHMGNLASDRIRSRSLAELAESARLLHELEYLSISQQRTRVGSVDGYLYFAARTGAGRAPAAVLGGKISSRHWRALDALSSRQARDSALRAIRGVIGGNDEIAKQYLEDLEKQELIEKDEPRGYRVTTAGFRALL